MKTEKMAVIAPSCSLHLSCLFGGHTCILRTQSCSPFAGKTPHWLLCLCIKKFTGYAE